MGCSTTKAKSSSVYAVIVAHFILFLEQELTTVM